MAEPTELFACWTAHYSVELVPPSVGGESHVLRFTPTRNPEGELLRDLFVDWFKSSRNGQPLPTLLNHLAPLAAYSPRDVDGSAFQRDVLAAAQHLGPLFTLLPGQTAMEGKRPEEPLSSWLQAAWMLRDLSSAIQAMTQASRDGSKKARKRRGERKAQEDIGHYLPTMSEQMRREAVLAYRPAPGISEYHEESEKVGRLIDAMWLLPLPLADKELIHLTIPRPRLSEETGAFQLNVPFGIQALLIMTLHDQSIGRTLVMRTCARQRCRRVVFMKPRQQYCSEACQRAAAAQRSREKLVAPKRRASARVGR